jgi:hypothetical protein
MSETSFEVPPEDAAEQDREVYPDDDRVEPSDSLEAPEADAAEQAMVVPAADDDYR